MSGLIAYFLMRNHARRFLLRLAGPALWTGWAFFSTGLVHGQLF